MYLALWPSLKFVGLQKIRESSTFAKIGIPASGFLLLLNSFAFTGSTPWSSQVTPWSSKVNLQTVRRPNYMAVVFAVVMTIAEWTLLWSVLLLSIANWTNSSVSSRASSRRTVPCTSLKQGIGGRRKCYQMCWIFAANSAKLQIEQCVRFPSIALFKCISLYIFDILCFYNNLPGGCASPWAPWRRSWQDSTDDFSPQWKEWQSLNKSPYLSFKKS